MRVVFVLRSAEIFPWLLRFVLPLIVSSAVAAPTCCRSGGSAFFFLEIFYRHRTSATFQLGGHRSHFGSRYPFRLKRFASLFATGSIPVAVTKVLFLFVFFETPHFFKPLIFLNLDPHPHPYVCH